MVIVSMTSWEAGVSPNAAYFLRGEAFGYSLLPLLKTLKIHVFHLFVESGSKLPHSEGALRAQIACGISRDSDVPGSALHPPWEILDLPLLFVKLELDVHYCRLASEALT